MSDIASSIYLSRETAIKTVGETFIVVCKDDVGLSVVWKGPKGRLGSKTHPRVQLGSYGTSIVFNKTRLGDTGNYTCTSPASKTSKVFRLIVEEQSTKYSTTEPSTSLEIPNNPEETNRVESTAEEKVELITTYINSNDIVTTTEESVVYETRIEHRHKNHRRKHKHKTNLETNNIPSSPAEENVENTNENSIMHDLFTTTEDSEIPPDIIVNTHTNRVQNNHQRKYPLEINNVPSSTTEENFENANDNSITPNLFTTTEESEIPPEIIANTHTNHVQNNHQRKSSLENFKFVGTEESQIGLEGKPATLRCEVNLNNVDISWSLANGDSLKNESIELTGGDGFIIKNTSREDTNIYTCQALHRSSGRIISKNITFIVQHKPYPLYAQENVVYGFLNEALNLTCEVEANPPPTIQWERRKMGDIIEQSSHKSLLQLNVTADTPGDFKCITSNKIGTFEKVFTVEIGVRPDPPENVTLVEATGNSLEIRIQATNVSEDIIGTDMEPTMFLIEFRPVAEEDSEWSEAKLNMSEENALLTDLKKKTKYEIRVAAENVAGISDYFYINFETSKSTSIHMKSQICNILLVHLTMLLTFKFWMA